MKKKYKTRQEIAKEYGINRRTLYRWLKKACIKLSRGLLSPREQRIIYNEFDDPNLMT